MSDFTTKEAVIGLAGLVFAVSAFGMKWQMDQDEQAARLEAIMARQTAILEIQTKVQENQVYGNISPRPAPKMEERFIFLPETMDKSWENIDGRSE